MANKDSNEKSKTSKTARVMSLLSKKTDPTLPAEEPRDGAPAAEPEKMAAPSAPPMLTSLTADAAVSGQIKDALEDALEDELLSKAPASYTPPVQTASPVQFPPPVQPESPVEAPIQAAPPAVEPPTETAPPAPAGASPFSRHTESHTGGYVNVMQVLVEEKAPKYVKLFGLCDCSRCLEDVKALALNHLPPKYVVMDQGDMIPKLTFYEGKYNSDITAQLLQACKAVMQRPHHNR